MVRDTPNSLVVSNDLSELSRVAEWVQAWMQRHEMPARTAEIVDLCSTEVVTNIMTHAFVGQEAHEISLRLHSQPDRLALEIQDDGSPFDPLQAEEPPPATSIDEARTSGWGIPIFRHFSDEMRYQRADGRNQLTLFFQIPPL
jgi:anti-sigma regulatory factor (Ser/Thr protein kinase)